MTEEFRAVGDSKIARFLATLVTKEEAKLLEDKITDLMSKISEMNALIIAMKQEYTKKEELPKIIEKSVHDILRPLIKK